MIINGTKIQNAEIIKVEEKILPGLSGVRKKAVYEARYFAGKRKVSKRSENLQELLDWIKQKEAA